MTRRTKQVILVSGAQVESSVQLENAGNQTQPLLADLGDHNREVDLRVFRTRMVGCVASSWPEGGYRVRSAITGFVSLNGAWPLLMTNLAVRYYRNDLV